MQKNHTQLLLQVNALIKEYEKHAELSGEKFNIFSIMGMESDEVRTHSAILGELLNPKGNHSLGSKPLELFIEQVFSSKENFTLDYNSSICQKEVHIGITNENKTEGGRVDLIVEDATGVKLVIENKIYAPEQKNQLGRYKKQYQNAKILYLTLDGKNSREDGKVEYESISYKTHILKWVEACAKEAFDKPMVREILNQYAFLIRKLTNQTTNVEMKEEIQKVIKENYLESVEIYKNFEEVRNNLVKEAFNKIQERKFLANNIDWNLKRDESDLWTPKTSQALLFSHTENSNVFYYLRYEYKSNELFLGIKRKGEGSVQRESVKYDSDFVLEYIKRKDVLINEIVQKIEAYIRNNIKAYNDKI